MLFRPSTLEGKKVVATYKCMGWLICIHSNPQANVRHVTGFSNREMILLSWFFHAKPTNRSILHVTLRTGKSTIKKICYTRNWYANSVYSHFDLPAFDFCVHVFQFRKSSIFKVIVDYIDENDGSSLTSYRTIKMGKFMEWKWFVPILSWNVYVLTLFS